MPSFCQDCATKDQIIEDLRAQFEALTRRDTITTSPTPLATIENAQIFSQSTTITNVLFTTIKTLTTEEEIREPTVLNPQRVIFTNRQISEYIWARAVPGSQLSIVS